MLRNTIIAAAFALASTAASAVSFLPVANAGFEMGAPGSYAVGSAGVPGWQVIRGGVDVITTQFASGSQALSLNGTARGGVFQILTTRIGQLYTVNFSVAANEGGPASQLFQVTATGSPVTTFTTTSTEFAGYTYEFTATRASTFLLFQSQTNGVLGPVLDNISVTFVPEPEMWAMLIAGFGLVGASMRRRRMTAVSA